MKIRAIKSQIEDILKSATLKNISFLMSANIISSLAGFIGSVLVLRECSNQVLGIIYPLIGVLMIVNQFADFGISPTFIKLSSQNKELRPQYAKAAFTLKFIIALIVVMIGLIFSHQIKSLLFSDSLINTTWIRVTLGITLFAILTSFYQAKLQIENQFKSLGMTKIIPTVSKLIILIILYTFNALSLKFVFIAFFTVPVLGFFSSLFLTSHNFYKEHFSKKIALNIINFSKWIFISSIVNTMLGYTDILMTRSIAGDDILAQLLGGQKLASFFPLITSSFVQVLLPKVSSMQGKKELNFYVRKTMLVIIPLVLVCSCLLPLSDYFINLTLGHRYNHSVSVFNIYSIGFLVSLLVTPLSLVMYRINAERLLTVMNISQLLLNIILNWIFISKYGAPAAAASTTIIKLFAVIFIGFFLIKEGILFSQKKSNS